MPPIRFWEGLVFPPGLTSARVNKLARDGGFLSHHTVMANLTARDLRSTTGNNVRLLLECSGLDLREYETNMLKEELVKREVVDIMEQDKWRVSYLVGLLEQRQIKHYAGDQEDEQRLSDLIDSLWVN